MISRRDAVTVQSQDDGSFMIIEGHLRLRSLLEINGTADAVDVSTGENLIVYELDGKVVILDSDGQEALAQAAANVIDRVRSSF